MGPLKRVLQLVALADIGAFVSALVERREQVFGKRFVIANELFLCLFLLLDQPTPVIAPMSAADRLKLFAGWTGQEVIEYVQFPSYLSRNMWVCKRNHF